MQTPQGVDATHGGRLFPVNGAALLGLDLVSALTRWWLRCALTARLPTWLLATQEKPGAGHDFRIVWGGLVLLSPFLPEFANRQRATT